MKKNDYSIDFVKKLEAEAAGAGELRPFKRTRYEVGDTIEANITGVTPAHKARARFEILKFAGGGFAGQVYQVRVAELDCSDGPVGGLEKDGTYALKILIPPSGFSKLFRNFTYWLAYQGPFSAQVSPAASRVGVLWQKLIRRGAKIRLGTERAVADTYATFFHDDMKSFAEINEWVPGRTWLYEIDDQLFERKKFDLENPDAVMEKTASLEYLGKRLFMHRFVRLFHEMGAPELARQYEWWTSKSQPNALKRLESNDDPVDGLCAIDFRAGLALLPFVPMSPGDFKLISDGFGRGNAVQFDRGDLEKLEAFMNEHSAEFADLRPALEELKQAEEVYRASLPDLSHHGTRVFYDDTLRPRVVNGLVEGYQCNDIIDEEFGNTLRSSGLRFTFFYLLGVLPILGTLLRKLWGNGRYRAHVGLMLRSWTYFAASFRARMSETLIKWYRTGRVGEKRALGLLKNPWWFVPQRYTLGFLPAKWHRRIAEPLFLWQGIRDGVVYGWRFYRNPEFRQEWLTDQITVARNEGMLSAEEEQQALESAKDPFIAKYLFCVAVHIMTIPVTQIVAAIVGWWFAKDADGVKSAAIFGGVMIVFQLIPISPGSVLRGLFVVYLMITERNWRDYKVACMISFWKYIGYLGFPIQMATQFPVLARLTAGRWAGNMVGIIPVFGEKGALLEHWVFDLFFNLPVSLGRRRREKKERARLAAEQVSH